MFAVTFSSESPNYASATHAAEFVQGAVPLGITQISWGTIRPLRGTICLAEQFTLSNPWDHCTSHSFAKNHSSPAACSLLNFSYLIKPSQAKSVYLGSGGGKNATTAAIR